MNRQSPRRPNVEPTAFGIELERRRLELGYESIREIAELAGVSNTLWGQVERGHKTEGKVQIPKKATPEFVADVVEILEWDLRETLMLAEYDPDSPAIQRRLAKHAQEKAAAEAATESGMDIRDEVVRLYDQITPEEQIAIRDMLVARVAAQPGPKGVPGPRRGPGGMEMSPAPEDKPARVTRRPKDASPRKRR